MASFSFVASAIEGDANFEKVAPGDYPAQIVDSGLDRNDRGTEQIKLVYRISGGKFDGRQVSQWYTVRCENQTAVDIGLRQLKGVCEAVGMPGFRDTQELHGRSLICRIGSRKNGDKEFADVKSVHAMGGAAPAAPAPAMAASVAATIAPSAPPAPTKGKKPWER